jgi:multicomponent Na+:H+ antiporter subunit C
MVLLVLFIAIYGLIVSDNLIKKVMCLSIIESIIILSFLLTGFKEAAEAPIITEGIQVFVDPMPQALMLTAIVIGVCFNSLAVAFIVKLQKAKGTVNVSELRER